MISAAVIALIWANSPWQDAYATISEFVIGPAAVHLDLSLATWAADGLLAIFFFVVGVELKHEIVAGSLRNPRKAGVPVFAAIGGMVVPAILYIGDRSDPRAGPGTAGLGDPDRDRHRLRAGDPRDLRTRPAHRRCGSSCSPWPSSMICWRSW